MFSITHARPNGSYFNIVWNTQLGTQMSVPMIRLGKKGASTITHTVIWLLVTE
jgi:hypothetical protein